LYKKISCSVSDINFITALKFPEILNYFTAGAIHSEFAEQQTSSPAKPRQSAQKRLGEPCAGTRKRESVLRHTHNEMLQLSKSHLLARTYLCLCGGGGQRIRKQAGTQRLGNLLKKYQIVGSSPTGS
jgi:hypothetical protein